MFSHQMLFIKSYSEFSIEYVKREDITRVKYLRGTEEFPKEDKYNLRVFKYAYEGTWITFQFYMNNALLDPGVNSLIKKILEIFGIIINL